MTQFCFLNKIILIFLRETQKNSIFITKGHDPMKGKTRGIK